MQLESTKQLLELDQMYGYSKSTCEWHPMKEITKVKELEKITDSSARFVYKKFEEWERENKHWN